jgi:hypothetical protein
MHCAAPLNLKVCSSTTTTTTGAAATCGTYMFINTLAIQSTNQLQCLPNQVALYSNTEFEQSTASPFRLTLAEGSIVGASILALWATAWGIKALVRSISSGDPER